MSTEKYFYPNRMGRVILLSMENAMGRERLNEVLKTANLETLQKLPPNNLDKKFPFEWVAALQEATEKIYGEREGRELNKRVGRLCFNSGLREFSPVLGIEDLPMRLMPISMKFRVGLEVFSRVFNQFSDQIVRLSEEDDDFLWIIERNPVCWGRKTTEPCCQLAGGILEESIFWGTGGKRYKVEETDCIAVGAKACVFRIEKVPLE
ncbi:MAG: 4-vinyl reductase [Chloroflexi bacterium]|nr:4-vinyl reductase [Chloroflexota bacterium]MBI5348222.1 4-vinyl reductase [Chloroflexota bacterium]